MEKIYDRFINQKLIIPFGRIIRGGILKFPRDQSMIGRKGQRQYLISWLLEPKKNGAFLITGNRGSGKTSFVNHCVSKYNINLYSRLVQNEVHFKIFDFLLIIFLIGFISLLLTLSISILTLKDPSVFIHYFVWPVLLLPFFAANQYSFLLFRTNKRKTQKPQKPQKPQKQEENKGKKKQKIFSLKNLLYIRFLFITIISSLVLSYGIAKIFSSNIEPTFRKILLFLDIQIFFLIGLTLINYLIHSNSKYKRVKRKYILLWASSFILIVPNSMDTMIYTYPKISSILKSLIGYHVSCVEISDIFLLFLFSVTFFFFTHFEYSAFKKEFRKNTFSSDVLKQKEKLVLISQWSIPVLIIKHYIPTITISLNMGFQNLQHSNIIHAMLIDLKSQYREIFLGRNHLYNNILPVVVAFLSVLLWNILSGTFIYDAIKHKEINKTFIEEEMSVGTINKQKKLLLKLFSNKLELNIEAKDKKENNDRIENNENEIRQIESKIKYLKFLDKNTPDKSNQTEINHLTRMLEAENLYSKRIQLQLEKYKLQHNSSFSSATKPIIKFNILDSIGVLILFIIFYIILYYRPLTRSRKNIVKIDTLLNKLSSKIIKSSSIGNSIKQGVLELNKSKSTSLETDPVDSRIVEIEMLELLNNIRQDKGSWFLSPGNIWTIPATSIIFIFDELDKLHNHSEDIQKTLDNNLQKNHSKHEAARSFQINKLLSDIKNFINTAPAKFIFVAGRDMHDQWLADTNSRENFLTSIFDSEIYIPSLLTDHSTANANIKSNIIKYVNVQYKKAEYQFCKKHKTEIIDRRKNQLKYYQLLFKDQKTLSKTFVEKYNDKNTIQSLCKDLLVFNYYKLKDITDVSPVNDIYKEKFILDFIRFLTYRSQGNPKQLERNLFGFTRPNYLVNSFQEDPEFKDWKDLKYFCANALHFGDHEVFRIQFIAELYQQIDNKVGNYILQTDDKMAMAIFYLSDFIMKFHDSSFSWRHLIRLDELAHIHRLPDLSNVFKRMVQHFSGIYLHRVLNGIFTYRFRSDISKEITYLSKISSVENASFNFTLDESGDLKSIFRRKIKDKNRASWDLTSGLGDLFELDGEYDDARHQYIGAIKILDKQYQMDHGCDSNNALNEIFLNVDKNIEKSPLRLNVKWVNERLSLMLLIGLTYEKEGRLTAALSHYRDTKSLAKLIFNNFLGKLSKVNYILDNNKQHNRNEVLKHFNILYQPIFAEAWLAEKLMGGIDTSLAIVEKGVEKIRNALPFVGYIKDNYTTSSAKVPHSNFAILASSLHNKVGDLAFFKGGQEKITSSYIDTKSDNTGYLHRAMFHYAIALHELRRFVNYRYNSSGIKYNPHFPNDEDKVNNTIPKSSRPDFINLTFASNLIDLGETCLAKVNIKKLFETITLTNNNKCNLLKTREHFVIIIDSWTAKNNSECNDLEGALMLLDNSNNGIINIGNLKDWFGSWNVLLDKYEDNIINFDKTNSNLQRLLAGILLTWVGIFKMEKGGYLESATKEYIELANASLNIVWWYLILENKTINKHETCLDSAVQQIENIIFKFLIELSISCLESALNTSLKNRTSVISPKRNINAKGTNPEFNKIMPEIITTAYSAQLLVECCQELKVKVSDYKLFAKIAEYTNIDANSKSISKILIDHLNYNRYPMLNRLRGLSILVYCSGINKCASNIGDLTSTIINYNDTYDAPFHYTYLELGICAYLAWKESIAKTNHLNQFLLNFKGFIKLSNISISEIKNKIKENKVHIQSTDININDLFNLITRNTKYIQLKEENGDSASESKNKYVEIKNEIINAINNKIEGSLKTEKRTKVWFENIAIKNLENSIDSHSMGKSYYENITKLYYLYDDFNDRRIHLNQAMQMLGTSMAETLLDRLKE